VERRETYGITVPVSLFDVAPFGALRDASQEPLGVTDRQALRRYLNLLRQPVEAPATERVVIRR
jgi:hypothetical protein